MVPGAPFGEFLEITLQQIFGIKDGNKIYLALSLWETSKMLVLLEWLKDPEEGQLPAALEWMTLAFLANWRQN